MDYNITFTDPTKPSFVVRPYTANGPREPSAPTPLHAGAVSANTSLVVLGKGAFDYGEPIQKNFVHLLENFANRTRPSYPIQGQLWFKTVSVGDPNWPTDPSTSGLYVFNGATWTQVVTTNTPTTANIDAGTYRVVNVANPVASTDALNVQTGDTRYIRVTGGTVTGVLSMTTNRITNVGDPLQPYDVVNLNTGDSRYLRVQGGVLFGTLDMNNSKITNVADATNNQDVLTLGRARSLFVAAGVGGAIDGGQY